MMETLDIIVDDTLPFTCSNKESIGSKSCNSSAIKPTSSDSPLPLPLPAAAVVVDCRTDLPTPIEFYDLFVRQRRPVLLRNQCPAVLGNPSILSSSLWNILKDFGSATKLSKRSFGSRDNTEEDDDDNNELNRLVEVNTGVWISDSKTRPAARQKSASTTTVPCQKSISFSPKEGSTVVKMSWAEFMDTLLVASQSLLASVDDKSGNQSRSDHPVYLTTQTLPLDDEGRPAVTTWLADLLIGQGIVPLRPPILGSLIPMNAANLWMGRSPPTTSDDDESQNKMIASSSSSGLHHDFHDNLYCLIRGAKTVLVAPPTVIRKDGDSTEDSKIQMVGNVHTVHTNGRIVYWEQILSGERKRPEPSESAPQLASGKLETLQCPVRPDGALVSVERILCLEMRKERIEESLLEYESVDDDVNDCEARTQLEEELDEIEEELLVIEMEHDRDRAGSRTDLKPYELDDSENDDSDDDDDDEGRVFFGEVKKEVLKGKPAKLSVVNNKRLNPTEDRSGVKPANLDDSENNDSDDDDDAGVFFGEGNQEAQKAKRAKISIVKNIRLNSTEDNHGDKRNKTSDRDLSATLHTQPNFAENVHDAVEFCPVHMKAGDVLYLPAGWFHEVFSHGSANNNYHTNTETNGIESDLHMAINYWVHPPDLGPGVSLEKPYLSSFWQRDWDARGLD